MGIVFVRYICKKTHCMKRPFLLTALAATLFFTINSNAQPVVGTVTKILPKLTIGIKAGANMQTVTGTNAWKSNYNPGIVAGAFVGVTKNKLGVQGEVLVRSAKFDVSSGFGGGTIKSVSLDVPVLLEYRLVSRLWIQLGPQFSSMMSAKNGSNDVKNNFNTSEFSGVLGLQANLPLHLTAGARYVLGLTDVRNSSVNYTTEAWNNRSIQLYVGFRFI